MANPYRDKRGRFASAGIGLGAAGMVLGAASIATGNVGFGFASTVAGLTAIKAGRHAKALNTVGRKGSLKSYARAIGGRRDPVVAQANKAMRAAKKTAKR